MKTYIINLKRSTKRRENILREVNRHGLDFEIVEGVDGASLSDSKLEELCVMDVVRQYPDWLTPGMLGAALSHLKVYRRIVEDGVEAALVLEDDAVLVDDFAKIVDHLEVELQESEIMLLHYMSSVPLEVSKAESRSLEGEHGIYYPINFDNVASAAGYLIPRATAKRMSEVVFPIKLAPDSWIHHFRNQGFSSIRFVYPMPVNVRGDKSTVAATAQSAIRARTTDFIDKHRIPPFHQLLKWLRLASVASRSHVRLVDDRSTLFENR